MYVQDTKAGVAGGVETVTTTSESLMPVAPPPEPAGRVSVSPRLTAAEIAFLLGFTRTAAIRRLWPGQPGSHSPWRPTDDGRFLVLDRGTEPTSSAATEWLCFLDRVFLAPSSPIALDRALRAGMRAGHRIDDRGGASGVHTIAPTGWHPDPD